MLSVIAVCSFVGAVFFVLESHAACMRRLKEHDGLKGLITPQEQEDDNVLWKL